MEIKADDVTVNAHKPTVFGSADGPGVEITRTAYLIQTRKTEMNQKIKLAQTALSET
jgi:hypothetical protein